MSRLVDSVRAPGVAASVGIVLVTALAVVSTSPAHARAAPECVVGTTGSMALVLVAIGACVSLARARKWRGALVVSTAVVAAVLAAVALAFALAALERATGMAVVWDRGEAPYGAGQVILNALFLGGVGAAAWGLVVAYPAALDEARVRAAETDSARALAENARLRACLEPHFLLNALHAVGGLVDEEPKVARRLIASLGDLYRDVLETTSDAQPLGAEIAWLRRYASILEARYDGAITFAWEVSPEAEAIVVPRMLLQPLVENAVKHGARGDTGEIVVRARVEADGTAARTLVCEIEDGGAGADLSRASPRDTEAGGHGLALVRQRLALRYGEAASFELDTSGVRTRAIVRITERT